MDWAGYGPSFFNLSPSLVAWLPPDTCLLGNMAAGPSLHIRIYGSPDPFLQGATGKLWLYALEGVPLWVP